MDEDKAVDLMARIVESTKSDIFTLSGQELFLLLSIAHSAGFARSLSEGVAPCEREVDRELARHAQAGDAWLLGRQDVTEFVLNWAKIMDMC